MAASAQPYREDPVDPVAEKDGLVAKRYAADPAGQAANRQRFVDYFQKAFFPAMTRTAPMDLAKLGDLRGQLFNQYILATSSPEVQSELTTIAYNALEPIILSDPSQPPYHPAVRYNAVLMMGMLDEQYARGAGRPLIRATAVLYRVIEGATTEKAYPAPLILGALLGLERHARLFRDQPPANANAVNVISTAALRIVMRDEPIPGLSEDEHAWLRLRAASVLAELGSVGPDGQVYDGLLHLIGNVKNLEDRCDAATLLTRLKYQGAQVHGAATAEAFLKLIADIGDVELIRAADFEARRVGGTESGGRIRSNFGGRDERGTGDFSAAAEQRGTYPRRPLVFHLATLQKVLPVIRPLVAADVQAKFDAVIAAVDPVIQTAANRDTGDLAMAGSARQAANELKRIGTPATPAAAPQPAVDGAN
jgi:hypothetical protein